MFKLTTTTVIVRRQLQRQQPPTLIPSASLSPSHSHSFATTCHTSSHVGSLPILYPHSVSFESSSNPNPKTTSPISSSSSSSAASTPSHLRVIGPQGQLVVPIMPFVTLAHIDPSSQTSSESSTRSLHVAVADPSVKHQRAVWGLTRALVANAVQGVSKGFTLTLRLVGVGYRATIEDLATDSGISATNANATGPSSPPPRQRLHLKLGYAHPVYIPLPVDVIASTPSSTEIVLKGIDKQRIGQVAAQIRSWRTPEPYNGKGIFVGNEVVRRKEGKKK